MISSHTHWSDEAWNSAGPLYESILRLPFVRELAAGTLPVEKFAFYLGQDSLYLADYSRVLAHIASRLHDRHHISAFLAFAADGIAVEQAMHATFLERYKAKSSEKSPSCLLYTSYLGSQATAPLELEVAAVLPCFKVYLEVGKAIMAMSAPDNPYSEWIATYSAPAFEESTRMALAIADELAASATPEMRRKMTQVFLMCTRMEWQFWHSAYELEKWKV